MGQNLYNKVWQTFEVTKTSERQSQLFIGIHLIHEVTSPQAFSMLRERGLNVAHPELTFATVDHIIPTDNPQRPLKDPMAEEMFQHLENNTTAQGIRYFKLKSGNQGIVHISGVVGIPTHFMHTPPSSASSWLICSCLRWFV